MLTSILIRIGTYLLFISSLLILISLCLAGYGMQTLVIITVVGGSQLLAYIALGIEDTVHNRGRGRHAKCQMTNRPSWPQL